LTHHLNSVLFEVIHQLNGLEGAARLRYR
jgi:hypothetical protein